MQKALKILLTIVFTFFILGIKTSFSQNNKTDLVYINKLIDSALIFIDKNEKLSFLYLNNALDMASESEYEEGLVRIYSIFSDIFEKKEENDNYQKFCLKKYYLLKDLQKNDKQNIELTIEYLSTIKKLAVTYEKQNEISIAIDLYAEGVVITKKTKNYTELVDFYRLIGSCYHYNEDYDNAIKYYDKSFDIATKIDNRNLICAINILKGSLLYDTNQLQESFKCLLIALTIAQKENNQKHESLCYTSISKIYYDLKMYDKALEYNKKSLPINKNIENSITFGNTYLRQANIYYKLNKYNKALESYKKSIVFLTEEEQRRYLAFTYTGMGKTYLKLSDKELAYENIVKGLSIRKNINRKKDISESYIALGEYFLYIQDFQQAKTYLTRGFTIAKEINNYIYLEESSVYLVDLYAKEGDYKKAYKYNKINKMASDSLLVKKNIELATKTELEYFNNLEKNEISLKLKETRKFYNLLYISLGSLIIFVIIILFIFRKLLKHRKELLIHERKTAKQSKLLADHYLKYKKLSLVASHTDNSIIVTDKNGKIEWLNKAFEKIYNKTLKELETEKRCYLSKISTNKEIEKRINYCLYNKKMIQYEEKHLLNEKITWNQVTITPIIENDKVVKLIVIESDITELKKAEEKINTQRRELENQTNLLEIYNSELKAQKVAIGESNEELRQHQEELELNAEQLKTINGELRKLSLIASETNNSIYLFDSEGNILWTNDALERNTGYNYEDFKENIGTNILEISANHDIDSIFSEFKETKRPAIYTSQFKTKSGKIIWLQTSLTPILDEEKITQIIAIDTDITKIKEAENKIFIQNSEITSSIHYASRIQKALLPMPIFINAIFDNFFILNKPRDIVSGDFYWAAYKNNKAIAVVADCTGHGIPGAFLSVLGMMSFNSVISKLETVRADIILSEMKERVISLLHQRGKSGEANDGMDASVCVFDFERNMLEYSGANSDIYIVKNSDNKEEKTRRIKADKISLDYNPLRNSRFTSHYIKIAKGDCIYMASDGYIDQFGGHNTKKFLRKNFETLLKNIHKESIKEKKAILDNTIEQWRGNTPQIDDILVFGIQI